MEPLISEDLKEFFEEYIEYCNENKRDKVLYLKYVTSCRDPEICFGRQDAENILKLNNNVEKVVRYVNWLLPRVKDNLIPGDEFTLNYILKLLEGKDNEK